MQKEEKQAIFLIALITLITLIWSFFIQWLLKGCGRWTPELEKFVM